MDTACDTLSSTASVEAHQTDRRSLTNGTGFCHPIPLRNFSLRTLVALYTATQHTLSQHNNSKTKRLNGAYIIPSFALHCGISVSARLLLYTAATQHTLSQHNDSKTKRLNGAYIIPSFALPPYQARLNNGRHT
jgi:hypothetical protein